MNLKNKNILVIGLGISGLSTVKVLDKLGANIIILDSKTRQELASNLEEIRGVEYKLISDVNSLEEIKIDLAIKSPGVPPYAEHIQYIKSRGIDLITDIELAYKLAEDMGGRKFIAITGTNGKTTTTSLVGKILKEAGLKTHIVGNIGVGILDSILESGEEDVFLIEASSFQLNDIKDFRPDISLILNLTSDHVDWHESYKNYIEAKKNIFKNQTNQDIAIFNFQDETLKNIQDEVGANLLGFSLDEELDQGIFIREDEIVIRAEKEILPIMKVAEVPLEGKHNLENVLSSLLIAYYMDVDLKRAVTSVKNFQAIEHRLEFVDQLDGVNFYNDSKGTNIQSSIKAVEAIDSPIILLVGGYDKKIEFDSFIKGFAGKVKHMLVMGESQEKIINAANRNGFHNYSPVEDMKEAIEKALKLSQPGDNILLSPACASWGMYDNYEERGKDFKDKIHSLKEGD